MSRIWRTSRVALMALLIGTFTYACTDDGDPDAMLGPDGPSLAILTAPQLTSPTTTYDVNGALWTPAYDIPDLSSVGSGVLQSFLRIQSDPFEHGYNTDANKQLDNKGGNFTYSLPLNRVPVFLEAVCVGNPRDADPCPGTVVTGLWREFYLDANESDSPPDAQYSIDAFDIWICYDGGSSAPANYDYGTFLAAQGGGECLMVYETGVATGEPAAFPSPGDALLGTDGLTSGSGNTSDYRILIPEEDFELDFGDGVNPVEECPYTGVNSPDNCGFYLIAYMALGWQDEPYETGATFEEISTLDRPVPGRKSGMKFEDLDADGVKDAGEPGLPGWTIYVDVDEDDAFTDPTGDGCSLEIGEDPCDVTDVDGLYEIRGIPLGTWDVFEVPQTDWTCSYPNAGSESAPVTSTTCSYTHTWDSGDFFEENDFGNWTTATKSGTKFADTDADGAAQETGEPGLQDWVIYVDYNDNGSLDSGEPSATTDASGDYTISGIVPGQYKVREVLESDWTCSYPNAGTETAPVSSTMCYHDETFESGDALIDNDFGNWTTSTKSGTKFKDLDADGQPQEAGEPGLSNWVIYVDYNDNGSLDTGEPSATTDGSGDYEITGILPGTYKVREVIPSGSDWICSYPNAGAGDANAQGVVTSTQCYHTDTFGSGEAKTGNDFGNWEPATKSGTKFEDLDADGAAQEAGEPGLSNWVIYVDYNDNGSLDTGEPSATTDGSGDYTITGIDPGTFKVREVDQTGYTCSYPNAGTETAPVMSTQCYHNETFQSGDTKTDNDFGNYTTTSKSGTKFEDLDADGAAQEAGEPGLSNWVIYVDYNDNGSLDTGEPSATTDGSGDYTISGIAPGTWYVREVDQNGWTCSFPNAGSGDADALGVVTSTACEYQENFQSGVPATGNDFGNWTTATKSGTKFEDLDADGAAQETGESGLSGWVIYVDYNNNGSLDTGEPSATTDGSGDYTITGIVPGTYNVREVGQTNWTCSYPNAGSETAPVASTQCYYNETFQSSGTPSGNDFGNWTTATKSGTKFEDLDADGAAQEAGESGLSGWVIYVDYNSNGSLDTGEPSATTDGNGDYTITGINPGTYNVREVGQTNWMCSFPNAGTESAPVTSTACYYSEAFQSRGSPTGNDFGNWTTGSKSGTKYNDLDNSGTLDAGEPGLSGWAIALISGGSEVATTTTDANGGYSFTGLAPGDYAVCEVMQSGWTQTDPASGFDCTAVSATYGPYGISFTMQSRGVHTGNDFGNFMPMNDETAWAANGLGDDFIGQLPYGQNWATYVEYTGARSVTLFAGQTHNAGTVEFSDNVGGMVTITITLNADWSFKTADGVFDVMVQDYLDDPIGTNPSPGQFDWKELADGTKVHTIDVPANNFYGVHAVVWEQ